MCAIWCSCACVRGWLWFCARLCACALNVCFGTFWRPCVCFCAGACVCWRRFALIRRRRKERSVPSRVARGTHRVLTVVLTVCSRGTHGVLASFSRTESTGEVLPCQMQLQRTKRCTSTAYLLRFRVSPILRACTTHAHTPTPLRQSLPPALSVLWSARVLLSAHVLWCRSLARASSRSTWCVPVVWGYWFCACGGRWYWRTLPRA